VTPFDFTFAISRQRSTYTFSAIARPSINLAIGPNLEAIGDLINEKFSLSQRGRRLKKSGRPPPAAASTLQRQERA
jgi:hypothetical protein